VSFSATPILWFLFAAAIPVIIHLLNRRRHRTVKWAAMSFILKATRESRGKKKLKHILILTMRTLAIAALVAAVAQPITNKLGSGGTNVETVVLVLDRSTSMEVDPNGGRQSKRLRAIDKVKETLNTMEGARLLLVDSASGKVHDIATVDALDSIPQTQVSDTQADIPSLIGSAVNYLAAEDTGRTEIWVASDLQDSNWRSNSKDWQEVRARIDTLENKPKLRVHAMDAASQNNKSIRIFNSKREGNELVLEFALQRSISTGEEEVAIQYVINGAPVTESVTIKNGQTAVKQQKRLVIPGQSDDGFGYIALQADDNPQDNISYFSYGKQPPSKTLLFTEGGETEFAFYRVASSMQHLECESQTPDKLDQTSLRTSAMVIWQAPLPSGKSATKLEKYIEQGGVVMFLPPMQDSEREFLGVKWGKQDLAKRDNFFTISNWNQEDGPWRDTISGQPFPMQDLDAIRRRNFEGDVISFADWEDGMSFTARKIFGRGRALFVSSLPDTKWSAMEHSALHLILFHRMIEVASERFNKAGATVVGSDFAKPAPGESRKRLDDRGTEGSNDDFAAGVWQIGERIIATNRPLDEDAVELVTEEGLETALSGINYTLFKDRSKDKAESFISKVWPYFLVAMLLFMITEAILCLQPKSKPKVSPLQDPAA